MRPDRTESLVRETCRHTEVLEKSDPVCAADAMSLEYIVRIKRAESVCDFVADRGNVKGREIVGSDTQGGGCGETRWGRIEGTPTQR